MVNSSWKTADVQNRSFRNIVHVATSRKKKVRQMQCMLNKQTNKQKKEEGRLGFRWLPPVIKANERLNFIAV
jgi:hypothetical protein